MDKNSVRLPKGLLGHMIISEIVNEKTLLLHRKEDGSFFLFILKKPLKDKKFFKSKTQKDLLLWEFDENLFILDETWKEGDKLMFVGRKLEYVDPEQIVVIK